MKPDQHSSHGYGSALRAAFRPVFGAYMRPPEDEETAKPHATTAEAIGSMKNSAALLKDVAQRASETALEIENDPLRIALTKLVEKTSQ